VSLAICCDFEFCFDLGLTFFDLESIWKAYEGGCLVLRTSVLSFLIFIALLLSGCEPSNPPAGQVLSIAKQAKTDVYKSYSPNDLTWKQLIPEDYKFEYQYQSLYPWMSEEEATENSDEFLLSTPVVESLDQQDIRLSGYVVPLTSDEESISEFLLVPVEGACLHVPAPPANQIVHVKPHYPLPIEDSLSVLNVVGTLTSTGVSSSLAAASYSIDAAVLEPYVAEVVLTGNASHFERGRQ